MSILDVLRFLKMNRIEYPFTAVPNALFPALVKVSFSPYEWRVILCIWRKSWGYQQKGCLSSYRDLASLTRLDIRNVHRTVKALVDKNVLLKQTRGKGTYFSFNANPITWVLPEKDDDRQLSLRLGPMRVINRAAAVVSNDNGHDNAPLSVETTLPLSVETTLLKKKESIKERRQRLFA